MNRSKLASKIISMISFDITGFKFVPNNKAEAALLNAIIGYLDQNHLNLITIQDSQDVKLLNDWLVENAVLQVQFRQIGKNWQPINAFVSMADKAKVREDNWIIPLILPKDALRKTIMENLPEKMLEN